MENRRRDDKWIWVVAKMSVPVILALATFYFSTNFTLEAHNRELKKHETQISCLEKVYQDMAVNLSEMKTDLKWIAQSMGKKK